MVAAVVGTVVAFIAVGEPTVIGVEVSNGTEAPEPPWVRLGRVEIDTPVPAANVLFRNDVEELDGIDDELPAGAAELERPGPLGGVA